MSTHAGVRARPDAPSPPPAGAGHPTARRRRVAAAGLLLPLVLLAVAGTLRFHRLGEPPQIYFDETYYVADARELLSELSALVPSLVTIGERKVYRDAMTEGRGACELDNDKARAEIAALAGEIYGDRNG